MSNNYAGNHLPTQTVVNTNLQVTEEKTVNTLSTDYNDTPMIMVVTSLLNPIAKKVPKDISYTPGMLIQGVYEVYSIPSMKTLYDLKLTLTAHQSFVLGIPENGTFKGNIVSKKNVRNDTDLTRTKHSIKWNKQSFILIDIDHGDIEGVNLNTTEDVYNLIITLDPNLKGCGLLIVASSSQTYDLSKKSWHVYILTDNTNDVTVDNYKKSLQSVAWIKSYGDIKISKAGSLLVRQIFDGVVFSKDRFSIESCFHTDPTFVFNYIEPLIVEGVPRDLNIDVEGVNFDLSDRLIFERKQVKIPEANKIREDRKSKEILELRSKGYSDSEAKKIVESKYDYREIECNVKIRLNDGRVVTAGEIKANFELYEEEYCEDPYYPEEGTAKAIITNKGDIHSFKHGGYEIKLKITFDLILKKVKNLPSITDDNQKELVCKNIKQLCSSIRINKTSIGLIAKILKSKKYIDFTEEFQVFNNSVYEKDPDGRLMNSDDNLITLLDKNEFEYGYNMISKDIGIFHPSINQNTDNPDKIVESKLITLALREGLPKEIVQTHLTAICLNTKSYNPLVTMITEALKKYDGKDYIGEFVNCFTANCSDYYKRRVIELTLIQAVAAWHNGMHTSPRSDAKGKFEYILTLRSGQGVQKTKLLTNLLDFKGYDKYFKDGATLKTSDKDSRKQIISYGMVELGELDATFRTSDISQIKSFSSQLEDELRIPYDRTSSKYKRRTVMTATVNNIDFLNDPTGARRFLVIELLEIMFEKLELVDMEMMWAQAAQMYFNGEKWWIDYKDPADKELNDELNKIHAKHQHKSMVNDIVTDILEKISQYPNSKRDRISPTAIFQSYSVQKPTDKEMSAFTELMHKSGYEKMRSGEYRLPIEFVQGIKSRSLSINSFKSIQTTIPAPINC